MLTETDDEGRPGRSDGVKSWHVRHIEAAQRRASGEPWPEIAKALGVTESSASNYTQIEGFALLVAYYQSEHQRRRFEAIEREAVELVVVGKLAALAALVGAAADGDVDAAYKFLEVIGLTERNRTLARFRAMQGAGVDDEGDNDARAITVVRRDWGDGEGKE